MIGVFVLVIHRVVDMGLLCDCHRGLGCHVHTLLRVMDTVFPPPGSSERHFGYVDHSIAIPTSSTPISPLPLLDVRRVDLSDSDDSGTEAKVVTKESKPDEILRIDEHRRGSFNALLFNSERPAWPSSWRALISAVRLLNCMCFWEIFSGVAVLTGAFADAGWAVAPPIDILYCTDYDLLNPLFLGVCLGLIFERRIRMLHVGPMLQLFRALQWLFVIDDALRCFSDGPAQSLSDPVGKSDVGKRASRGCL